MSTPVHRSDNYTPMLKQRKADEQAWSDMPQDARDAFADYYAGHPGRSEQGRLMGGHKAPLGPAAWMARKQLGTAEDLPWHQHAVDRAVERAAKGEQDLGDWLKDQGGDDGTAG